MKCKPYSEITVEIRTQLKTVKITSNIFAVQIKKLSIPLLDKFPCFASRTTPLLPLDDIYVCISDVATSLMHIMTLCTY